MNRNAIVAGLGALMAANVACADSVSFSTGNYYQSAIGDEIGSGYDIFQIDGLTNTVSFMGSTTAKIADYTFTVGGNCNSCTLTPSYTADFTITVGAATKHLSFGYSWASTGPIDTLTIGAAGPVSFDLGEGKVLTVEPLAFGPLSGGGGPVSGPLDARFTIAAVPEPETYAMFLAGLGMMGAVAKRRRARA